MNYVIAAMNVFGKNEINHFQIDESGIVRVFDDIAGHYTLVHSMSSDEIEKIKSLPSCSFDMA